MPGSVGSWPGWDLDLVHLSPLMALTEGASHVTVGLIDGPVQLQHPGLGGERIRVLPGGPSALCSVEEADAACKHGTHVAGMLAAKRGTGAPAICPGCTILLRPIFADSSAGHGRSSPVATADQLSSALMEVVDAGAQIINLSLAHLNPSSRGSRHLQEALDYALNSQVIVVVASGNQGRIGESDITSHPATISVVACDAKGQPTSESNLGRTTSRNGLRAPGVAITSLHAGGELLTMTGTSTAVPYVTGTIALLWSMFRAATTTDIRRSLVTLPGHQRTIVPSLLNAWGAYLVLKAKVGCGGGGRMECRN